MCDCILCRIGSLISNFCSLLAALDWAVVAGLISSIATFILALITFIQVRISNRARMSIYSEFDELYNKFYLVMSNIGNLDCIILDVEYSKETIKLLKMKGVLPKNWKHGKYLPFQGFRNSSFNAGVSKFCELKPQIWFDNGDTDVVLEVTIRYMYKALWRYKRCKATFNVCMSEYLSTRTSFTKPATLKDAVDYLTRAVDLGARG